MAGPPAAALWGRLAEGSARSPAGTAMWAFYFPRCCSLHFLDLLQCACIKEIGADHLIYLFACFCVSWAFLRRRARGTGDAGEQTALQEGQSLQRPWHLPSWPSPAHSSLPGPPPRLSVRCRGKPRLPLAQPTAPPPMPQTHLLQRQPQGLPARLDLARSTPLGGAC